MVDDRSLLSIMRAIAAGDQDAATLPADPDLAAAKLSVGGTRSTAADYFLVDCALQLYVGDTALHVAAACYDDDIARTLVDAGADVQARNRRGAEPLHAATTGGPGSNHWDPPAQAAIVTFLIEAGADPNAVAAGGVTPLHRAVRNRCSSAVRALLDAGADPALANHNGSTALMLAGWTTGRGGTGSAEAKAEQAKILELLSRD